MINASQDNLKHSAQTKKVAADALIRDRNKHPSTAAYLLHVSLECAMKRRILIRNKVKSTAILKERLSPEVFESLFSGVTGHDLHHLAKTVSLRRYLEAHGKSTLLDNREWHKMCAPRPYSLRYGIEKVPDGTVNNLVKWAISLTDLILREAP